MGFRGEDFIGHYKVEYEDDEIAGYSEDEADFNMVVGIAGDDPIQFMPFNEHSSDDEDEDVEIELDDDEFSSDPFVDEEDIFENEPAENNASASIPDSPESPDDPFKDELPAAEVQNPEEVERRESAREGETDN